jgi:iron complex transport system permease protein
MAVTAVHVARADAVAAARDARRVGRSREVRVVVVLAVLLALATAVSLCLGQAGLTPGQVLDVLLGRGDAISRFVVLELRGPRLASAVLVGACLGLAGAILQSVVRNVLASPDVVGLTAGASAAGVVGIVWIGLSGLALSGFVLVGTLASALAVYLLAWRDGLSGYRFVLVGIGVAALGTAVVSYVLTRTSVTDARIALTWLTGSLNGAGGAALTTLAVASLVAIPAALVQGRRLAALELGDEAASALGVRAELARGLAVLTSVVLAAVAVAAAGPVAFVALVAGPVARRLTRTGAPPLLGAALVGALVVVVSDAVAQFAVPGVVFPVGVVTGIVGAPYLLWLLARTNRAGRGG